MSLSTADIMGKLNEFANSSEGKKVMADKIRSYKNGSDPHVTATGRTYGGGKIMTDRQMIFAAKKLIEIVRSTAASSGLPNSVMEHIESLDYTMPFELPDGSKGIQIYISDNPKRESLYPQKYAGVDNIVAIFNNGYTAGDFVYGKWHGNSVRSLDKRQGSFFMQKAVDQFLAAYSEFDVSVDLSTEYSGVFG